MRITKYETDNLEYSLELKNPKEDLWGIMNGGQRLRRTKTNGVINHFEYEPLPSNRDDEWIKDFSFTLEEGKERLKEFDK